jgi:hypothetical protein
MSWSILATQLFVSCFFALAAGNSIAPQQRRKVDFEHFSLCGKAARNELSVQSTDLISSYAFIAVVNDYYLGSKLMIVAVGGRLI